MATIILSHDVENFDSWKPYYEADSSRREEAGFKELAVGTQSDDPKKVFMIWQGDPVKVEKMLQDPELAELMKEAGVTSVPEVTIINS